MPVDHAICIVAYNSVSKQLLASNVTFSYHVLKHFLLRFFIYVLKLVLVLDKFCYSNVMLKRPPSKYSLWGFVCVWGGGCVGGGWVCVCVCVCSGLSCIFYYSNSKQSEITRQ